MQQFEVVNSKLQAGRGKEFSADYLVSLCEESANARPMPDLDTAMCAALRHFVASGLQLAVGTCSCQRHIKTVHFWSAARAAAEGGDR